MKDNNDLDAFPIGYFLQNRYGEGDLTASFGADGVSPKAFLGGEDKAVWFLCHKFGFETRLMAFVGEIDGAPVD